VCYNHLNRSHNKNYTNADIFQAGLTIIQPRIEEFTWSRSYCFKRKTKTNIKSVEEFSFITYHSVIFNVSHVPQFGVIYCPYRSSTISFFFQFFYAKISETMNFTLGESSSYFEENSCSILYNKSKNKKQIHPI